MGDAGDQNEFDGCECIMSHEMAMRRLLSWIRQSQTSCTDTDCIDAILPSPTSNVTENFTMMTMFFVFAVILYYFRPNSMRPSSNSARKHNERDDPNNGAPPAVF